MRIQWEWMRKKRVESQRRAKGTEGKGERERERESEWGGWGRSIPRSPERQTTRRENKGETFYLFSLVSCPVAEEVGGNVGGVALLTKP
jgi:ribosomal 30S subunit maturation factor RimM